MPQNWKTYRLGDVIQLKRGYDLPSRIREKGAIPIISSSGITDFHSASKVKSPGVVTGRYGTIGKVFYSDEDFWPLNTTLYVRDFKGNYSKFIYYLLQTIDYKSHSTKSAVPGVDRNDLHEDIINLPPLPIQRRIASILGALDDKIELNLEMNKTLEEMAMSLYKHWFVDFGPFKDGNFVESELGMIPEGWEVKKLGDISSINCNSIKSQELPAIINYLDISSVKTGSITGLTKISKKEAPSRARRAVLSGDILWSSVRPNRKSYYLALDLPLGTIASTGFTILSQDWAPFSFLYCATTTNEFVDYLVRNARGAAYPAVTGKDFENYELICPKKEIIDLFHESVTALFELISQNSKENFILSDYRDTLLPKLISGEVEVKEAEEEVSNVV